MSSKPLSPDQAREKVHASALVDVINRRILESIKQMGSNHPIYIRLQGLEDQQLKQLLTDYEKAGWHPYFNFRLSEFVLCFNADQLSKLYAEAVKRFYCDKV